MYNEEEKLEQKEGLQIDKKKTEEKMHYKEDQMKEKVMKEELKQKEDIANKN